MSLYPTPFQDSQEPTNVNIRAWCDNLYTKYQPIESARWNQANIDSLFYAGAQNYVSRYFGVPQTAQFQKFYFNLLQVPLNMITGYQRQHRKSIMYTPIEGADPKTTDQYTKLITNISNANGIHETFSKACELAAVSGLVLLQPYLDYTEDSVHGTMKLKLWEYNSFICDPFAREADWSDSQLVWTQEYISREEAISRFGDEAKTIKPMAGPMVGNGSFYFLPEAYYRTRTDLYVLSYIWTRGKRKKKKLYSAQREQVFDISPNGQYEELLAAIPDLEIVEVEVNTWKLTVVLNDQKIYHGKNPLEFDRCPFIPVFWCYEPHMEANLRVRSLVRSMRDANWLMSRRIIINHDISEATINAGWMRKSGAVANEDNLKQVGQGYDVIINEGYEMTDVQKIMPSAVPESDLALADQLRQLINATAGIDLENWSAQQDKQTSALTALIKQAANLMVFQKFFDQWDYSLKLLGELMLEICLLNYTPQKIATLINEEPTALFYNQIFAKYHTVVQEGLLTPTQASMQAQALLDINQAYGREVFPPSFVVDKMNIQGKAEAMEFLRAQEASQAEQAQQQALVSQVTEEAKMKETMARTMNLLSQARKSNAQAEADVALFEERISKIVNNRNIATKNKMEALEKLMDVISKYGEIETMLKQGQLETVNYLEKEAEDQEAQEATRRMYGTEFATSMMSPQNMQMQ